MDTDTPDGMHRTVHEPQAGDMELRQGEEVPGEDAMMEIRLPIASTGQVRNEGDDPLSGAELRGMARQVDSLTKGVFPEHGASDQVDGGRYTQFEKLGYWADADLQREAAADDSDLLVATARMPDPDTLPASTREYRTALAILKEQALRGIPIAASIGWRDDPDAPGGVDLMEASIVGIGADPRTNTGEGGGAMLARAAAEGADVSGFVDRVRELVRSPSLGHTYGPITPELSHEGISLDEGELYCYETGEVNHVGGPRNEIECPACGEVLDGTELMADLNESNADVDDARPLGPPGDRDRFETFEECVSTLSEDPDVSREDAEQICGAWENASKQSARAEYDVNGTTVDITPPDAMQNAAALALEKAQEGLGGDCGTGVGTRRANQIVDDEVGPDVIDEVAAYLTSHEEDVTADGPPSDWSDEEWDDCGNIQYAKWGGTGSGAQKEWAQGKANEVADARDEELPYPDRAARNIDDPEFSEGDAVSWTWQGETVHGRVSEVGEEFTVSGNTITGEEGEAVYLIHEWDEDVEAFRRDNVAKPESSLSESTMDMPEATEENFQSMSTDDTRDDAGTTDGEQTAGDGDTERGMDEKMEEMRGMIEENTRLCREMHEYMMEDGDDEEMDDEEDEEQAADTSETEQAAEGKDGDRDTDDEDLQERIADLEAELESVRSGETDVDTPDAPEDDGETDEQRDATDTDDSTLREEWLTTD
jgi:hypothetical protein